MIEDLIISNRTIYTVNRYCSWHMGMSTKTEKKILKSKTTINAYSLSLETKSLRGGIENTSAPVFSKTCIALVEFWFRSLSYRNNLSWRLALSINACWKWLPQSFCKFRALNTSLILLAHYCTFVVTYGYHEFGFLTPFSFPLCCEKQR